MNRVVDQVVQRLRGILRWHHEQPVEQTAPLAVGERSQRFDHDAPGVAVLPHDGVLADHDMSPRAAGGLRAPCERLTEADLHGPAEGLLEMPPECQIVALGKAGHAGAGELGCERIHDHDAQRLLVRRSRWLRGEAAGTPGYGGDAGCDAGCNTGCDAGRDPALAVGGRHGYRPASSDVSESVRGEEAAALGGISLDAMTTMCPRVMSSM